MAEKLLKDPRQQPGRDNALCEPQNQDDHCRDPDGLAHPVGGGLPFPISFRASPHPDHRPSAIYPGDQLGRGDRFKHRPHAAGAHRHGARLVRDHSRRLGRFAGVSGATSAKRAPVRRRPVGVIAPNGIMRAVAPLESDMVGRDFSFRAYFSETVASGNRRFPPRLSPPRRTATPS